MAALLDQAYPLQASPLNRNGNPGNPDGVVGVASRFVSFVQAAAAGDDSNSVVMRFTGAKAYSYVLRSLHLELNVRTQNAAPTTAAMDALDDLEAASSAKYSASPLVANADDWTRGLPTEIAVPLVGVSFTRALENPIGTTRQRGFTRVYTVPTPLRDFSLLPVGVDDNGAATSATPSIQLTLPEVVAALTTAGGGAFQVRAYPTFWMFLPEQALSQQSSFELARY